MVVMLFLCSLSLFQEAFGGEGGKYISERFGASKPGFATASGHLARKQDSNSLVESILREDGSWSSKPPPSACCQQSKGDFAS